jgi:5-methylcytosine-specific restriction endonuclease McrA
MSNICLVRGCKNERTSAGTNKKTGAPILRSYCLPHYKDYQNEVAYYEGFEDHADKVRQSEEAKAIKAGFPSAAALKLHKQNEKAKTNGFHSAAAQKLHKQDEKAKIAGYADRFEQSNAKSGHRQHLNTYCENVDGRLGFRCTSTILKTSQLEADHVYPKKRAFANGWAEEQVNAKSNIQTLCACCHKYKTLEYKDYSMKLDVETEALLNKLIKFIANKN